jgi:PHS family inorganic phosphate transporter-like MFS transporter
VGNIIIQAAGYLPGFYVGIFLPDRIGRVPQQFWTCIMVCILYAIWAGISTQSVHTPTVGLMLIFVLWDKVIVVKMMYSL